MRMMTRWARQLACCLPLILAACADSSAPESSVESAPVAGARVKAVYAREHDFTARVIAQGSIRPWEEALISSRLAGLPVVDIRVDTGDVVDQGQVLVVLNDETVRNDVRQAEALVAEATAALDEAQTYFRRTQQLETTQAISEQDALLAKTRADGAAARLASAQANLAVQRLRLDYTLIRAPDAGVISDKRVVLGQVPNAGEVLLTLIRQNKLEWVAEVLPADLPKLSLNQAATVRLRSGEMIAGRIRKISPALDAGSRLGLVYIALEPEARAQAGMFVDGEIQLAQYTGLMLPARSVLLRDGRHTVYQVDTESATVKAHTVELGQTTPEGVEIRSGIDSSMLIAADGAGFLTDGDVVTWESIEFAETAR